MTEAERQDGGHRRFGIRDATHLYSGIPALEDVSFEIEAGTVHGLVGENGSGKSTLIKIITGAIQPTQGQLYIDDQDVRFDLPLDARESGIGVVHQDYNVFPDLTVTANVAGMVQALPRRRFTKTVETAVLEERVRSNFHSLGIDISPRTLVQDLDAAERKLMEIARAMLLDSEFLILDEPTASLEPEASRSVLDLLDRLRDQGIGLAFVSHRLDEILKISDVVSVLRDGREVATVAPKGLNEENLAELIVGSKQPATSERQERAISDDIVLEVDGLQVREGAEPVSFSVRRGEIFGLTGLLGSGATELAKAIGGARPLEGGSTKINGQEVGIRSPRDAMRAGIGFIPEDRKAVGLVPDLNVAVNVALASLKKVTQLGWMKRGRLGTQAEDYRERLDIRTSSMWQACKTLSGGNQQKVLLAKWLNAGVGILAIEEPTHGIDIGGKTQVHELLMRFADDGGTVLVASTDVNEVLTICDRIGVMRHGALLSTLESSELKAHELAAIGAKDPESILEDLIESGSVEVG